MSPQIRTLLVVAMIAVAAEMAPSAKASAVQRLASPEQTSPIVSLVDAVNRFDLSETSGLFVANAVFIDAFAPFRWDGENAGSEWLTDFARYAAAKGMTNTHVSIDPAQFVEIQNDRAYLVVPATLTATLNGRQTVETAAWTFVLVQHGTSWKIASGVWAKTSIHVDSF